MISDRSLAAIIASERHSSRHPIGAECVDCGTTFPVWLVADSDLLCCECLARREGRAPVELHALGGLTSPIVVEVGANLHRLLSLAQDLTWRAAGIAPGSPEAIATDLVAFLALKDLRP